MILFEDRRDDGIQLIERLQALRDEPCVVLGLPRGGVRVLDSEEAWRLGLSAYDVGRIETRERAELARREAIYRCSRYAEPLAGKTVIIADDGIATGSTMIAALRAVRHAGASRVVAAAPVIAADTVATLERKPTSWYSSPRRDNSYPSARSTTRFRRRATPRCGTC